MLLKNWWIVGKSWIIENNSIITFTCTIVLLKIIGFVLVGALSPSFDTLPENMQKKLRELVNLILKWLTDLLEVGLQTKVFSFNEQPQIKAYMVHSALLSSLQMNKVLRNDVYKSIQAGLLSI